ncbi:hypothetical protein B0H11DRAFT_1900607 [Mycena galericulata]|nr:hypothetical protein B0H11DRAFT_1900607 [Mycena galericulata]
MWLLRVLDSRHHHVGVVSHARRQQREECSGERSCMSVRAAKVSPSYHRSFEVGIRVAMKEGGGGRKINEGGTLSVVPPPGRIASVEASNSMLVAGDSYVACPSLGYNPHQHTPRRGRSTLSTPHRHIACCTNSHAPPKTTRMKRTQHNLSGPNVRMVHEGHHGLSVSYPSHFNPPYDVSAPNLGSGAPQTQIYAPLPSMPPSPQVEPTVSRPPPGLLMDHNQAPPPPDGADARCDKDRGATAVEREMGWMILRRERSVAFFFEFTQRLALLWPQVRVVYRENPSKGMVSKMTATSTELCSIPGGVIRQGTTSVVSTICQFSSSPFPLLQKDEFAQEGALGSSVVNRTQCSPTYSWSIDAVDEAALSAKLQYFSGKFRSRGWSERWVRFRLGLEGAGFIGFLEYDGLGSMNVIYGDVLGAT